MIHTTIGIYPDGSYKVNGVHEDNLQSHIEYNRMYRPGRALVVDGELVYNGCMKELYLIALFSVIPIATLKRTVDTQPYK